MPGGPRDTAGRAMRVAQNVSSVRVAWQVLGP
jgi:hypothetical protein